METLGAIQSPKIPDLEVDTRSTVGILQGSKKSAYKAKLDYPPNPNTSLIETIRPLMGVHWRVLAAGSSSRESPSQTSVMSAASSESQGDFEDVPHRRGRSREPCVISASWVMQLGSGLSEYIIKKYIRSIYIHIHIHVYTYIYIYI